MNDFISLPVIEETIINSRQYSEKSDGYVGTHGGKNWQGNYNVKERTYYGGLGQRHLYHFCKTNDVPVKLLETPHTDPDNGDIEIWGEKCDVKTSTILNFYQVQKKQMNDAIKKFIFCYYYTEKNLPWIVICGYLNNEDIINDKCLIKHNELLPIINQLNKFETGSYVYTGKLKSGWDLIGNQGRLF